MSAGEWSLEFDAPIPAGWRLVLPEIEVAGTGFHFDATMNFANDSQQSLELEPEPSNPHDPNAVKVIGNSLFRGIQKRYFLGYVPRVLASEILPNHAAWLRNIRICESDWPVVRIEFDLIAEVV